MSCHHPPATPLPSRSLALRETPFHRHFLTTTTPLPCTHWPFSPVSLIPPFCALALAILCLIFASPSGPPLGCPGTGISIRYPPDPSVRLWRYSSTAQVSLWRAFVASRTVSRTISLRYILISRTYRRSSRPLHTWRSASVSPRATFCLSRRIPGDASSSSSVRYLFFIRLRRHRPAWSLSKTVLRRQLVGSRYSWGRRARC